MMGSNKRKSKAKELVMRCLSCKEEYDVDDLVTCGECYEEAKEAEKQLLDEIEDLKSTVSFLALPCPYFDSSTSDVVLVAVDDPDYVPIPAHRHLLASRSPVFKAMLENDMTEKQSGTIKISEVSFDALDAFTQYLYTAEVSLDNKLAYNLLVLGEKYQVKQLKTYCEKYLIAKTNWNKAIANYAFAYQYNCEQLLRASLAVILDHMDLLIENEGYDELVNRNPRLLVEIYEAYIFKKLNTEGAV